MLGGDLVVHAKRCPRITLGPNEWIPPGDLTTAIDLTEALVRPYTTPLRLA